MFSRELFVERGRYLLLALCLAVLAWAFASSSDVTEIAAGIAVFLFGMLSLERGFASFTGWTLERLLGVATNTTWKSISFGIVSTALMQSSSLVSLLTISFVSAQMISLAAGIGVVLGTNLGTTSGAWLIAGLGFRVDISAWALPLLSFGMVLLLMREARLKGVGHILFGVGLLFLGIHFMQSGFSAFQSSVDLLRFGMDGVVGLLLFIVIGMVVTVIVQSSHATLLIIIAALAAGQVSFENALALAIGANLGTTVTAAIASLTAHASGKRLAVAHLGFNLTTGLIAVVLIDVLVLAVDRGGDLLGLAEDDLLLRLALFHTLFNLLGVLLFAPWVGAYARVLERHVRLDAGRTARPQFLHGSGKKLPQVAVAAVRNEIFHLYDNAFDLLVHGLGLRRRVVRSEEDLTLAVQRTRRFMPLDVDDDYEQRIKGLHSAIVEYISDSASAGPTATAGDALYRLRQASHDIVLAIKDMKHLHKNLKRFGLSANPVIRGHYDQLRIQIAGVLRDINALRQESEEPAAQSVTVLSLDARKVELERAYREQLETIEAAIRSRRISGLDATSLMNDADYAWAIGRRIVSAAQTLLAIGSESLQDALEALSLDEQEVEQAAHAERPTTPETPQQRED